MRRAQAQLTRALILALVGLTAPLVPADARAVEIRVRGQGKLYADFQAAGTTLQVVGSLRDELGEALPQRTIVLTVTSPNSGREVAREELVSDMTGRFQWQRELGEGDYTVAAKFAQTEHLDGDELSREVQLVAVPPRVDIHAPKLVVGTRRPANLRVRVSAAGIGVRDSVEVMVGDAFVEELQLDDYGRGALDLVPHLRSGENTVTVRLPAGRQRAAAQDSTTLRFSPRARLEVEASVSHRRLERGLVVTGRVTDENGPLTSGAAVVTFERAGPVPGRELDEVLDDAPAALPLSVRRAEALVDDEGRFEGFLPGQYIDDGQWRARVRYRPDAGEAIEVVTAAVLFDRTRSRWTLNLLGLLAILFGGVVLLQRLSTIDLRSLLARWRRRGGAVERDEPRFDEDEPIVVEVIEAPEAPEQPAGDLAIAGVVWDGWRGRPIPFAKIELLRGDEVAHTITAMSDGRFASPPLRAGSWHARVTARGFARGTLDFELPHDGELSYFRLGLVAIPLKIRRFYQAWVRRIHGEELWGRLSPRQIEGAVWSSFEETAPRLGAEASRASLKRELRELLARAEEPDALTPDRMLLAITEIVEESYFSNRVYDEELWLLLVAITRRLDDLLAAQRQEVPR